MIALVTGGTGMVGRALIQRLRTEGVQVRNFDLIAHPDDTVESIIGDLRDVEQVEQAVNGVDTIFHVASVISLTLGEPQHVYDINVVGTENIIKAAQKFGVKQLIYTSSIDVIFDGSPLVFADETTPYPDKHLDFYGKTKKLAEKKVLNANGNNDLVTCSLRPASVYGPHDNVRFPSIFKPVIESNRFVRIGNTGSKASHIYVDNLVHAHWLAAQALTLDSVLAGQAYNITDHDTGNFFDFFIPFLEALELDYTVQTIPTWVAWLIANIAEWRYAISPTDANALAQLNRYAFAATTRDFTLSHAKATRDFGYEPIVSQEEAFQQTLAWLRDYLRTSQG